LQRRKHFGISKPPRSCFTGSASRPLIPRALRRSETGTVTWSGIGPCQRFRLHGSCSGQRSRDPCSHLTCDRSTAACVLPARPGGGFSGTFGATWRLRAGSVWWRERPGPTPPFFRRNRAATSRSAPRVGLSRSRRALVARNPSPARRAASTSRCRSPAPSPCHRPGALVVTQPSPNRPGRVRQNTGVMGL
jgi:hypothetical protein